MRLVARGLGIGEPGALVFYGLGLSGVLIGTNFDCAVQTIETFTVEQSIEVWAGLTTRAS
jgi:hypothetical protein